MEQVLDKCLTPTTEMIANLIEIENAHINTNHPDFVGSADSLLNLFSAENDGKGEGGKNYSLIKSKETKSEVQEKSIDESAQIFDDQGIEEEKKQ